MPRQVYEFKREYPDLYERLFERCGWQVKVEGRETYLYYEGVTGKELKAIIRNGFNQIAFDSKRRFASKPLAAFVNAITTKEHLFKQVLDFAVRTRDALELFPDGIPYAYYR